MSAMAFKLSTTRPANRFQECVWQETHSCHSWNQWVPLSCRTCPLKVLRRILQELITVWTMNRMIMLILKVYKTYSWYHVWEIFRMPFPGNDRARCATLATSSSMLLPSKAFLPRDEGFWSRISRTFIQSQLLMDPFPQPYWVMLPYGENSAQAEIERSSWQWCISNSVRGGHRDAWPKR